MKVIAHSLVTTRDSHPFLWKKIDTNYSIGVSSRSWHKEVRVFCAKQLLTTLTHMWFLYFPDETRVLGQCFPPLPMFPLNLVQRCILTTSELNRWQRRCDRLTQLLRRIKFPPLNSFTLGDAVFRLPLKAIGPPSGCPRQEDIEYFNGFFDGDGALPWQKAVDRWSCILVRLWTLQRCWYASVTVSVVASIARSAKQEHTKQCCNGQFQAQPCNTQCVRCAKFLPCSWPNSR